MQTTTRFAASWPGGMVLAATLLAETPAHAAEVYSVNFNGADISIGGPLKRPSSNNS